MKKITNRYVSCTFYPNFSETFAVTNIATQINTVVTSNRTVKDPEP
jgi:hypothetical protein